MLRLRKGAEARSVRHLRTEEAPGEAPMDPLRRMALAALERRPMEVVPARLPMEVRRMAVAALLPRTEEEAPAALQPHRMEQPVLMAVEVRVMDLPLAPLTGARCMEHRAPMAAGLPPLHRMEVVAQKALTEVEAEAENHSTGEDRRHPVTAGEDPPRLLMDRLPPMVAGEDLTVALATDD